MAREQQQRQIVDGSAFSCGAPPDCHASRAAEAICFKDRLSHATSRSAVTAIAVADHPLRQVSVSGGSAIGDWRQLAARMRGEEAEQAGGGDGVGGGVGGGGDGGSRKRVSLVPEKRGLAAAALLLLFAGVLLGLSHSHVFDQDTRHSLLFLSLSFAFFSLCLFLLAAAFGFAAAKSCVTAKARIPVS